MVGWHARPEPRLANCVSPTPRGTCRLSARRRHALSSSASRPGTASCRARLPRGGRAGTRPAPAVTTWTACRNAELVGVPDRPGARPAASGGVRRSARAAGPRPPPDQLGVFLPAQDHARPCSRVLQLGQRTLDLPAFMGQGREPSSWCRARIEDRRHEPGSLLGAGSSFEPRDPTIRTWTPSPRLVDPSRWG